MVGQAVIAQTWLLDLSEELVRCLHVKVTAHHQYGSVLIDAEVDQIFVKVNRCVLNLSVALIHEHKVLDALMNGHRQFGG